MKKPEKTEKQTRKLDGSTIRQVPGAALSEVTGGRTRQKELLTITVEAP